MMEKTWRWFGPSDKVTPEMLRQIGVEGVVTSLHHLPPGILWPDEDVGRIRRTIEEAGLRWSVVESLPVSEPIKYGGPSRDEHIDNYRKSLEALGRAGVRTVCYNFMPVIDWIRTDLERPLPGGGTTLYFDYARFAYFDIYILGRGGASADYPAEVLRKVEDISRTISEAECNALIDTIITKTQGFINGPLGSGEGTPVERFKALMRPYRGMTRDRLRSNLKYFLDAVMPVCDKYGIDMCIHSDDPPMPVFGMPRLMCDADDIRWVLSAVDNPHCGITFCAGSLSAGKHNDVVAMAREFAPRTHFVHLRACETLPGGDFVEAPHIGGGFCGGSSCGGSGGSGGVDLAELTRIFCLQGRRIPMRVDHGPRILGDEGYNPGYSFHGRMLAFAQICGMMDMVRNELKYNIL